MSPIASHVVLFAGLLLVSTAGPFLVAGGMDASATVLWRLLGSSALFLGWAAVRGELRVPRAAVRPLLLGAALLTAHFALWVKAFDLTDYASNLLLLVTQPVFAALVGTRIGERSDWTTWVSVVLAAAGLAVIAGGDISLGPRALLGDLLCVVGTVAITFFYVVTKELRASLPLPTFLGWSFAAGVLMMLPIVVASGATLVDYPPAAWGWLAGLVVLTTLGGHGLMNLAARHVTLFTLNVVIVLEPPLAIAIGAPIFGASVSNTQLVGGAVLAVAVVIGLLPTLSPAVAAGRLSAPAAE